MSSTPTTAPSSVPGPVLPPNSGAMNSNAFPVASSPGFTTNPSIESYVPNERVLCFHGPLIYEAKVMKVKVFDDNNNVVAAVGPHYLVHYKGWKQTWDEWVPPNRLLKMTEENLTVQKTLQQSVPGATGHGLGGGAGRGAGRGGAGGGAGFGGPGSKEATRGRKDARGTKRGREEDDGKKSEMKLNIPEVLKARLVDDWEAVTKNNQLLTLPVSPTVAEILSQFADHIRRTPPTHLKEPKLVVQTFVDGLQTYFDRAIGNCLLYRFERIQYATIRRLFWTGKHVIVGQEKPMSMIYGAEHLLRMLVNLPQMVTQANLDFESVIIIRDYSNELMSWMVVEKERIFQKEYANADVQYQNLSRS